MHAIARNADIETLVGILNDQQAVKDDIVTNAGNITAADNGTIIVGDAHIELSMDGVTNTASEYTTGDVFDDGVSTKLGIPRAYVRRMREENPELWAANVNSWLQQDPSRKLMVRTFGSTDPDGFGKGYARALLSDRYAIIDNIDVLTAALTGIRKAGADVEVKGSDLTERAMRVNIDAPSIAMAAPELLAGYRSPFTGQTAKDLPIINAGLVIANSETGGGALTLRPRLTVQVCTNGMVINKDVLRAVHLGGKQEEGIIKWSSDTQRKNLDLITARTHDAVVQFLDVDFLRETVKGLEAQAGVEVAEPTTTIKRVGKTLGFSQGETEGILGHFIKGGQVTAGGVMQAVTSYSQNVEDPDQAWNLESKGLDAMALAATAV